MVIEEQMLATVVKCALEDLVDAKVVVEKNVLDLNFENGQKFRMVISECEKSV